MVKRLNQVNIGEQVTIRKLEGTGAVKRRIMDMGLTKGTEVTLIRIAPLGDPIDLSVRGYQLSIRLEDAEKILVEEEE